MRYAFKKEDDLIENYIKNGPTHVKEELGLNDETWLIIFDYLVFEHNLLYKCVVRNTEFFLNEYIKYGMTHVRDILDTGEDKYDAIFNVVFDYLAISKDGLYYHVIENREKYTACLWERGTEFVRKVLNISRDKYTDYWTKVLDFLLNVSADKVYDMEVYEKGISGFCGLFNRGRQFRPINKFGII